MWEREGELDVGELAKHNSSSTFYKLLVNYPCQIQRISSSAKYGLSIAFLLFVFFLFCFVSRLVQRSYNTIALKIVLKSKALQRHLCHNCKAPEQPWQDLKSLVVQGLFFTLPLLNHLQKYYINRKITRFDRKCSFAYTKNMHLR